MMMMMMMIQSTGVPTPLLFSGVAASGTDHFRDVVQCRTRWVACGGVYVVCENVAGPIKTHNIKLSRKLIKSIRVSNTQT